MGQIINMALYKIALLVFLMPGVLSNSNINDPSGNEIYFSSGINTSGRDIYKMNEDGSNKIKLSAKLGTGHNPHNNSPKLSPDGSMLVFHSDPDGHDRYTIWTMNTDGTNPKKLTQKEGLYAAWSPDGRKIVFSGRRKGIWEILLVSIENGKEEFITHNGEEGIRPGWGAACSFHPNGKSIIYSYIREKTMYSLNLETNKKVKLSPEGKSYLHPMYSKDGSRIAVNRKKDSSYELITVSPKGGEERVIVKDVISYSGPSWSDSGKAILFTGMVNDNQEIFKINLDSGQETQLTTNSDFDAMPTWK